MAVTVENLTVEFGNGGYAIRPLDNFAMHVEPGRLALLLGPSGCGKTTLLSCLSGMLTPTSGRVTVDSTEVTALKQKEMTHYRQRSVGVVFQAFNLVPSMTALENVMMPMRAAGIKTSSAKAKATELLNDVGLGERLENRPGKLSGGQMQRVAIARALALDPPVVVADEPTANLDHVQVETVLRILRSLTERGHTLIVSTHDQRLLPLADDVIHMDADHHAEPPKRPTYPGVPATEQLTFERGHVLFNEGDAGKQIFRVDTGSVDISHGIHQVAKLYYGDMFGEMAPLFRIQRTATATVSSDTAHLTAFSIDEFINQFGGELLLRLVARHNPSHAKR
jgi:putative ABC transport system ATP-binding protein